MNLKTPSLNRWYLPTCQLVWVKTNGWTEKKNVIINIQFVLLFTRVLFPWQNPHWRKADTFKTIPRTEGFVNVLLWYFSLPIPLWPWPWSQDDLAGMGHGVSVTYSLHLHLWSFRATFNQDLERCIGLSTDLLYHTYLCFFFSICYLFFCLDECLGTCIAHTFSAICLPTSSK